MKCIYKIENTVNGKLYIGSTKNFESRKNIHLRQLRSGTHHNIHLLRAFIKYGEEKFVFSILEECELLFEREQYWINILKPEYNIGSVGGGDNISNHPNKEKIKKKHSLNRKLKCQKMSEEERKKLSKFGKDNPNWKGGISSNTKCKKCKKNISVYKTYCVKCSKTGKLNPFYGKKHTEETKNKLKIKNAGRKPVNSKQIEINGTLYISQADAAKALGISPALVTYRIKKGIYIAIEPKTNLE